MGNFFPLCHLVCKKRSVGQIEAFSWIPNDGVEKILVVWGNSWDGNSRAVDRFQWSLIDNCEESNEGCRCGKRGSPTSGKHEGFSSTGLGSSTVVLRSAGLKHNIDNYLLIVSFVRKPSSSGSFTVIFKLELELIISVFTASRKKSHHRQTFNLSVINEWRAG